MSVIKVEVELNEETNVAELVFTSRYSEKEDQEALNIILASFVDTNPKRGAFTSSNELRVLARLTPVELDKA